MEIKSVALNNFRADTVEIGMRPVVRSDKIRAFVVWTFKTLGGDLKIRGGTVRVKKLSGGEEILAYDAPAYFAGRYRKSFFWESEDYKRLCDETIKFYCHLTGENLPNYVYMGKEEG